jgi:hypothetical protein
VWRIYETNLVGARRKRQTCKRQLLENAAGIFAESYNSDASHMDGLIVIDKPIGPTSHDVVARVRRVLQERRIGHTGTLDPIASGVLPLVVGRGTRLARFFDHDRKQYDALVYFGRSTDTYDARCDSGVVQRRTAAGARGDRRAPRRVPRNVRAAAAGILGQEDRRTPEP